MKRGLAIGRAFVLTALLLAASCCLWDADDGPTPNAVQAACAKGLDCTATMPRPLPFFADADACAERLTKEPGNSPLARERARRIDEALKCDVDAPCDIWATCVVEALFPGLGDDA